MPLPIRPLRPFCPPHRVDKAPRVHETPKGAYDRCRTVFYKYLFVGVGSKLGGKQAHRPRVSGLAASAGDRLTSVESEISAGLWALKAWEEFFVCLPRLQISSINTCLSALAPATGKRCKERPPGHQFASNPNHSLIYLIDVPY